MEKVIVIGSPGAGKSTLSRKLQALTGLPLIYMDMLFWREDKTHLTDEELDEVVAGVINGDKWILDGNYRRSLRPRIEACDTVIFLDFPEAVCIEGISERIGRKRADMPWTEEELDPEFYDYVKDFHIRQIPLMRELLKEYPDKKVILLRSRKEAKEYLSSLEKAL